MNKEEKKLFEDLSQLVKDLTKSNNEFKAIIDGKVETISKKLDVDKTPINLEKDILSTAQSAVNSAIKEVLTKYDSPLTKIVKLVVDENSNELKGLISDSFTQVIRTDDFKQSIVSAFSHKISRSIISNNDGLFDKVSNELKQDAQFKAKMVVAVANVVEECLKNK